MAPRMVALDVVRNVFLERRGKALAASQVVRLIRRGDVRGEQRGARWFVAVDDAESIAGGPVVDDGGPVIDAPPGRRAAGRSSPPPKTRKRRRRRAIQLRAIDCGWDDLPADTQVIFDPPPKRKTDEDCALIESRRHTLRRGLVRREGCAHDFRKVRDVDFWQHAPRPMAPRHVIEYLAQSGLIPSAGKGRDTQVCLRCFKAAAVQNVLAEFWSVTPSHEKTRDSLRIPGSATTWGADEAEPYDPDELPDTLQSTIDNWRYAKTKRLRGEVMEASDVLRLWRRCGGRCELTDVELHIGTPCRHPRQPSLDRIDSTLGYFYENCRIVTYQANLALSNFGTPAFDAMCRAYVAKHPA